MSKRYIASVSFGKDSLAMLLKLIESGCPLDEVVFFDTGMEFQSVYTVRDQIKPLLGQHNIIYTELTPEQPFLYSMLEKPVNGPNGPHLGYSWCGGVCRWGTTEKLKAIDRHAESKGAFVYVGIAADEVSRLDKGRKAYKLFPLVDWGWSEVDCLQYCQSAGYNWPEKELENVGLYDLLDRVSCWCCTNKNLKELRNIYQNLPSYWERLKDLQSRLERPMKGEGKSVYQLEARFQLEDRWVREGRSITGRDFHTALKVLLTEVGV